MSRLMLKKKAGLIGKAQSIVQHVFFAMCTCSHCSEKRKAIVFHFAFGACAKAVW
jgi:hypothetical protein